MGDKVVVECSPLGYGRAGPEEGFIEKDSQSFGDAERTAAVFHGIAREAGREVAECSYRHGNNSQSRSTQREERAARGWWWLVGVNDVRRLES